MNLFPPIHVVMDANDLRRYVSKVGDVPKELEKQVTGIIEKGALNIKEDMVANMSASKSFGHLAKAIHYEKLDAYTYVIGMVKTGSAKTTLHKGGNIAYFGSWKGGGGREDPIMALKREIPKFEEEILRAVNGVF